MMPDKEGVKEAAGRHSHRAIDIRRASPRWRTIYLQTLVAFMGEKEKEFKMIYQNAKLIYHSKKKKNPNPSRK